MAETAVAVAQSVADAVKKVADAAVAEISKTKTAPQGDFQVTGVVGGKFHIYGNGFRASGSVLLNGVSIPTVGWSNEHIEGRLPADAKSGPITVWIDKETQQHSYLKLA